MLTGVASLTLCATVINFVAPARRALYRVQPDLRSVGSSVNFGRHF